MRNCLPTETSFAPLDFLPLGVFILGSDLTVLFWNKSLEEWTHISRSEILGQRITNRFPHLSQPEYLSRLNQVFEGGHPILLSSQLHSHLIPVKRPDGQLQVQHTTITASPGAFPGDYYAIWSIQDVTDLSHQVNRYRIEKSKARRSEAALAEAQRMAHLGNWELDLLTHHLSWSDELFRIFGLDPNQSDISYADFLNYIHSDDRGTLQQKLEQAIAQGLPYSLELRFLRANGSIGYMQAQGEVKYNKQGQREILFGTVLDITAYKQLEAAYRESEERWQLALRGGNDGIWDWNLKTNEVLFSDCWKEVLGLSDTEETNHLDEWLMRIHPDDVNRVTEAIQDYFDQKIPVYSSEYRIQCRDGTYKWVLDRGQALWNEAGTVVRMVGSHTDISQRKQVEAALTKELLQINTLLSTSIDGIVVLNDQGNVVQSSHSFSQMLGYSAEDMLTLNVVDWDAQWGRQDLAQILTGRIPLPPVFETCHRRQDGSCYDVEISYNQVKLDDELFHFCIARDITERKRVERERQQTHAILRQSEEKFRLAIDFTYNWEYWQAPDGSFVYVSPSCERITGYGPDEFINNPALMHAIIHPDDRSHFEHHICENLPEPGTIEFRIIHRTGHIRWLSHICQPVLSSDGNYLGRRGSNQDISERVQLETERQQSDQALRESEARFQAFMNHSPAAAWITDADGMILYLSQSYFRTFQMPPGNFVGQSIFDLFGPEIAQPLLENIQTVAQSQQAIETLEIAPRLDGTLGDFLVYKFPIPDASNNILVGGVAIDLTQQHRAEEDLRHQKEMFQAIVDHIPIMIALFDARGQVEFINPEVKRILGWSLEDWQQRNILAAAYPAPTDQQAVLEQRLAATGQWQDLKAINTDGQALELSCAHVRLSNGNILGIGQDISDRKHKEVALRQAMEEAEAANLAKSMFLANMSHELRTPLNVILGFTQVMAHDASLTSMQQADLQTIQRSGDHLLSLINDILDLSKIEAGHCLLEDSGFDLISLLHTLRAMMADRARAKQLRLHFDIAPEVPQFVIADEQKLRQVLLNLLSNAIKFTKQGHVLLRVTSQATQDPICAGYRTCQLQFEVTDTGVGIAVEEQETIFDAFVQAEAGKKSVSGTGLGLTISRKLLELMHGSIAVHSSPGQGSTFTATIPICPTSGIDAPLLQHPRRIVGLVPGQSQRRILVVDDQPENRLLMVRLLAQLGLDVREATNGQEAIQLWQQWHPDLTWMDIRMPGLDGYEATKQIRSMEQENASVIIALTAQASQSDRTLAVAAGCNDYISKPFQEATVFLKMSEYLGLEYLYTDINSSADSTTAQLTPSSSSDNVSEQTLPVSLNFSRLSEAWIRELEAAAICGNDRLITHLANQLPPDFQSLAVVLVDLANQFQFEQILNWLHDYSRSDTPQ